MQQLPVQIPYEGTFSLLLKPTKQHTSFFIHFTCKVKHDDKDWKDDQQVSAYLKGC